MAELDLIKREKLPDALRVLVESYPREAWEAHPNFSELTRFWLDRHLMFRRLLEQMNGDAEALLDAKSAPEAYARKLHQYGGMFLNQLHQHHGIEDEHYFPQLAKLDTRLEQGFELLDSDHHTLDARLADFAKAANAALSRVEDSAAFRDLVAGVKAEVGAFEPMLNRHLLDEEELIVPVILEYAPSGLA